LPKYCPDSPKPQAQFEPKWLECIPFRLVEQIVYV
jgi:hypothetical protein